jgi:hypothetical protein
MRKTAGCENKSQLSGDYRHQDGAENAMGVNAMLSTKGDLQF